MLKKKYYDGFTVHDILNKHLDDGHKILELLTAFAGADGVDAVEVVRCRDCKHRITANCERFGIKRYTQSDSFCSWAEPKETS